MPGSIDNSTELEALNQIIVALNELTTVMRSCNTTTQCPPNRPPDTPGDEPRPGESIPPGTSEERKTRQCRGAIFLVDMMYAFADRGNRLNLDDYYNSYVIIDAAIEGAILGFTVGFIGSAIVTLPTGPDDALVGSVAGAIGAAFEGVRAYNQTIELGDITTFVSQNRTELICALSSATNGLTAQWAFRRVVDGSGLSLGNKIFLKELLNTNIVALLFFVNDNSSTFEQILEAITETCPCQDIAPATPTTLTNAYKCKAANYIIDSFSGTVGNLGTLGSFAYLSLPTFISVLTEGLLGSLLVGIFANVPLYVGILSALVSRLATLAWRSFNFFTVFTSVAASLETDKTEIVCELYEAANSTEPTATARTSLEARIDTYVDTAIANTAFAVEADTFKSVLKLLLSNSVLNALAEINTEADVYTGTNPVDCAGCTEKLTMILTYYNNITYGSVVEIYDNGSYETLPDSRISITSNHFKLQSNLFSFQQYQFHVIGWTLNSAVCRDLRLTFTNYSASGDTSNFGAYVRVCGQSAQTLSISQANDFVSQNSGEIVSFDLQDNQFNSSGSFSIEVEHLGPS